MREGLITFTQHLTFPGVFPGLRADAAGFQDTDSTTPPSRFQRITAEDITCPAKDHGKKLCHISE
jgi:hypothetical protein